MAVGNPRVSRYSFSLAKRKNATFGLTFCNISRVQYVAQLTNSLKWVRYHTKELEVVGVILKIPYDALQLPFAGRLT